MKGFYKFFSFKFIILAIFLFVLPVVIIPIFFKCNLLNCDDWGNIIGGCLGYYGAVILGVVATFQTSIALKQTEKTFKADKYSSLNVTKDCDFQLIKNNETFETNRHKYNMNQYYVCSENNFEFNPNLKFLKLRFLYKTNGSPINEIKLKNIILNYDQNFFVDENVKTDLCVNAEVGDGQIEIVFMLTQEQLKNFNKLLNDGQFILNFEFIIKNCFNVKIFEKIEMNFNKPEQTIKFTKQKLTTQIETTSYNFSVKEE